MFHAIFVTMNAFSCIIITLIVLILISIPAIKILLKTIGWMPEKSAATTKKRLARQGIEITAEQEEEMANRGKEAIGSIVLFLGVFVAIYVYYITTH